jgi:hypothetical protein
VARSLFDGDAGPGYLIHAEAGVSLEFESLPVAPCGVVRMSPEALWFSCSTPRSLQFNRPLNVRIRWSGGVIGPLRAQVVQINASSSRSYLGLKLNRVSPAAGREMLRMLSELVGVELAEAPHQGAMMQEDVTQPERLATIASTLVTARNKGVVRGTAGNRVRVQLVDVDRATGYLTWSSTAPLSEWGPAPYSVDAIGYNSVYRLELGEASEVDGKIVTPPSSSVRRVRHRWFRRGPVRGALQVECTHPIWPDIEYARDVRDVSFGGLCFTASVDDDLVYPGLVFPAVLVRDAAGESIWLRGEVRTIVPARGGEPGACGLRVTPCSPEDERRWVKLVCDALYPNMTSGEEMLEPLWGLFTNSGYFNLAGKSEGYFDDLKRSFADVGQRAAEASHLFCQAVWAGDRGVEATLSSLKPYTHTWLGHQLAKRPGRPPSATLEPGQILRETYLRAFEHPQSDPDFQWLLCYVDAQVLWNQRSHLAFTDRHADTGEAFNQTISMFEVFLGDVIRAGSHGMTVGPASPDDTIAVLGALSQSQPQGLLDALDLVPGRIDMSGIAGQWQAQGLQRERSLVVARRDGHPVCAAVLETGPTGSNLFRLLDSVRLVPLAPDAEAAHSTLMAAAQEWFEARGKDSFLYMTEHADATIAGVPAGRVALPAQLWCISAGLLPEFLEHVCLMTSRRH